MVFKSALVFSAFCALAYSQDPASGTGGLTIQVGGKTVGRRSTLNLTNAAGVSASGIVQSCSDNPSENRIDCRSSYNSAFISTHDSVHANENYCHAVDATTAFTCKLPSKALSGYSTGITLLLNTEQPCPSSCTLNVDNLGSKSIKRLDGTTDPGGMLLAHQPQWVFYDGRVFRLVGVGAVAEASATDQRRDVIARRVIGAMDTMTYAAVITLDVTAGDLHKTLTANSAGNATINASTGGLPGQHMWVLVANDRVNAKTVTFGVNFRSSGTLAGTPGKTATVEFVSDGTSWYEVARTLNL